MTRRFRLAFAAVAAVLLAAVGLLVWRALASVDLERRVRHETVAERVFDEMERALSTFVAAEEARPADGWRDDASPPFLIGRFEVDAQGTVRIERNEGARREIEDAVAGAWKNERRADAQKLAYAIAQAPGSTVPLEPDRANAKLGGGSAYGALQSLNKGVEQRAERKTKVFRDSVQSETAPRTESVELSPLEGRRTRPERFVLFRTVARGGERTRQGLLLDVPAFGRWLGEQALGSSELESSAAVDFEADSPARSRAAATGELRYRHRFGEPFADLTASLALAPLGGLGGAAYVAALASLSLLAVVVGLAALYRMTSVVLVAAEQRGNFVAAVTHELKTPLTAIRMYAEMLRDGIVPSEAKRDEYYRHITAESERLTRLVNNVLELSRLEKGTRGVTLETGDLGTAVRDVASVVRPHVEGAGFALDVAVDPGLPAVRFERDAVMQILTNLVDNAVKYADGGTPKTIELHAASHEGGARLAVRDHGPGVPARHLGRIFEPFVRAENELTRRTKGTGLGLALVRGLAERMGAKVTGSNAPGGGFEVAIEFPRLST